MPETEILESLRESAVLVDGSSHEVLRATGADRIGFLHRITSGKVQGMEVGQGCRTLLLDVRGRVLVSLLLFPRSKSIRCIVSEGQGQEVVASLSKFAIMDDFQIVLEPELATLAILGPKADEALARAGVPVPPQLARAPLYAHTDVASDAWGMLWVAHGRACGADGLCVTVPVSQRPALAEAILATGVLRLPAETGEFLRVLAMEPRPGSEISSERFPVEIGLGRVLDHTKGCYVGQETIVRMRDRGTVKKRLTLLRLSGDALPSRGDKIETVEQAAAGFVTSAARMQGEAPVALAILSTALPVGAQVQVRHGEAVLSAEVVREAPPWG